MSCDEDLLLLEVSSQPPPPPPPPPAPSSSSAAAAAAAVGGAAGVGGAAEYSDEDNGGSTLHHHLAFLHHPQHHHHHHLGGIKRQLEIGSNAGGGDFLAKSGVSSDGSDREMSDDVKEPKRLKQPQQPQQQQQQQQQVHLQQQGGGAAAASAAAGDAFKKDREEWSDSAISALLDAYTEKFLQLNKGNLRGRHWQEVSDTVSMRGQGQKSAKTIEQCKNKVDSLKKRHKVERTRMETTGSTTSQWPWFEKVEQIVGSAPKLSVLLEEDASMVVKKSSSASRQRRPNSRTPSMSPAGNSLGFHAAKTKLVRPRWQRVLLKVSGEALAGDRVHNVDPKITMGIAKEVLSAMQYGVEVAIVVGGGNFFRGVNWAGTSGLDRASADHIGMMATMMNAVILQASLESVGIKTRIQTAYSMPQVAEPCMCKKAVRHLERGRVVIFGGGTGNPYSTTDTAAAIRAAEIKAEIILKASTADGIFDCDSKFLEHVSFRELAMKGLTALDAEAMNHCEQNNIPVMLFNISESGNVLKALTGERVGTLIDQTGKFG